MTNQPLTEEFTSYGESCPVSICHAESTRRYYYQLSLLQNLRTNGRLLLLSAEEATSRRVFEYRSQGILDMSRGTKSKAVSGEKDSPPQDESGSGKIEMADYFRMLNSRLDEHEERSDSCRQLL